MDLNQLTVIIENPDTGAQYAGIATRRPRVDDYRKPISVGLSPHPAEYTRWFNAISPGHAAFARVFAKPGTGLPSMTGQRIRSLPDGTLPWISHKDHVPISSLVAYWAGLKDRYAPPTGRQLFWTPQHEHAPAGDAERRNYLAYLAEVAEAAQDSPWIRVVQVQSAYAMRWRGDETDWREWLLPNISLGFDTYPPQFGSGYEPVESSFGLLRYAAEAIGAPTWGVPELGAEVRRPGAAARADWLVRAWMHLDEAGADFVGLWCSQEDRDGEHFDYRPTDTPTLQAFATMLTPPMPQPYAGFPAS